MNQVLGKALLIGNNDDAPYHPLHAVDSQLQTILKNEIEVVSSDDYDQLIISNLSQYNLCISYTDCWSGSISDQQMAGLLTYVAGGGNVLVLHCGISIQTRHEGAQLVGARFTGHPESDNLSFRLESLDHPILKGISTFEMMEEPYRFNLGVLTEREILLSYAHEGEMWPAAWTQTFGLGRVVYLMPGHELASFQHPEYAKLLVNTVRWLTDSNAR
jgi:type 1 glutamine amidotransferase